MSKTRIFRAVSVFFMLLICTTGIAAAEESNPLTVHDPAICLDVAARSCVDANDVFPASVEKLFCFTKILGALEPVEITHVWYFGDVEKGRVPLTVRSASFRTYSSKRIQLHEVGNWRVDVVGPGREVLKSITFEIVP